MTDKNARSQALAQALDKFDRIDVLANIAGAGAYGAIEEFSSEQIRANMELNFFAPAELSREVLPYMRAQKSGHIFNLTSIAGLVGFAGSGLYNASKFALEGFTEALYYEVKPLGIHATIIEPGGFRTEFAGSAAMKAANSIADYAQLDANMEAFYASQDGKQVGDSQKAMQLVVDVVESDNPPMRLMLGKDAYQILEAANNARQQDLKQWQAAGENSH